MMKYVHKALSFIKKHLTIRFPNGKEYVPSFSFLAVFALGMVVLTGLYWIAVWNMDFSEVTYMAEPNTFHTFMAIAFFLSLFTFFDLLYRKKASHVLLVLLHGISVFAYCLTLTIVAFEKGSEGTTSGIFYAVCSVCTFLSIFSYIFKALNGDADWKFKTINGCSIVFLFLAVCFSYSILDSYEHIGDTVFWLGLLAGLFILLESVLATSISTLSDYDPHPIQLDEFGNPVGDITANLK